MGFGFEEEVSLVMLTPARREEQERAEGGPSTSGLGKELRSTGRMDSLLNERSGMTCSREWELRKVLWHE